MTLDGRIGVTECAAGICFFIKRPEGIGAPFDQYTQRIEGPAFAIGGAAFHDSTVAGAGIGHTTLCDATAYNNPRACAADPTMDCYDVTVMMSLGGAVARDELWGRPVRIMVANPKAPNAQIARVTPLGAAPARAGFTVPSNDLLEPSVDASGRLLFFHYHQQGIRYAVVPLSNPDSRCDVTQWTQYRHISEMHTDPNMASYPIAKFPFRDHQNNAIPPGAQVYGAYPWIDREGRNLMFTTTRSTLYYEDPDGNIRPRYPVVGDPPAPATLADIGRFNDNATRLGLTVAGLWTNGKMVSVSKRLNHTRLGFGNAQSLDRTLKLYSNHPGVEVGRSTITIVSSVENRFNFLDNVIPQSLQDVAWRVSVNAATDEVAFDDYLDRNALVVSPMAPAINSVTHRYEDGFEWTGGLQGKGYTQPPRVENSATSLPKAIAMASAAIDDAFYQWNVPPFGTLHGGARTEVIAAGGVVDDGIWLDGNNDRIAYEIPPQDRVDQLTNNPWFTSIWIDPRIQSFTSPRRLLTFPDGSWIDVESETRLAYGIGATKTGTLTLPAALALAARKWTHIAVLSQLAGVRFYIDGFELANVALTTPHFRLASGDPSGAGTLEVGAVFGGQGFRGWVDELKVIGAALNEETICNHAYGTLVGTNIGDAYASAYPVASHNRITALLGGGGSFAKYFCEIRRPTTTLYVCVDKLRTRANKNPRCIRSKLLFGEGPLYHDAPRPDSTINQFCLHCHDAKHPSRTLTDAALVSQPTLDASLDPRRQPMQSPRRLFGVIPAGLFGPSAPANTLQSGALVDVFTLPTQP